jgi:hypothetical protein
MHEALRQNIQADLMKVDALSYKDEHVNPRSAIVIQTMPPVNSGGVPTRTESVNLKELSQRDRERRQANGEQKDV